MGEKSDAGMGKSGAQKIDGAVLGVTVNDDDFLRQIDPMWPGTSSPQLRVGMRTLMGSMIRTVFNPPPKKVAEEVDGGKAARLALAFAGLAGLEKMVGHEPVGSAMVGKVEHRRADAGGEKNDDVVEDHQPVLGTE